MALDSCKFLIEEHEDAEGNKVKCEISISEIIDITKLKNIEISVPSQEDIFTSITTQADIDITKIKTIFENALKNQLITPHEYATALIQVLPQIYTQASQNVLQAKQLEAEMQKLKLQVEEEKIKVLKELLGIKEQDARAKLYEEQTKAYRDQTRLKATDMITKAWLSIYSQNQTDQPPTALHTMNVDDTIRDLFQMVGMSDPLSYSIREDADGKEYPETTTDAQFDTEQNIGPEDTQDSYQG